MPRKSRTPSELIDHFWSHVIRSGPDECWGWSGALFTHGYPMFHVNGNPVLATRFMMMVFHVPLATCIFVCHTCDNPSCVNPRHLFMGDHQKNMDDRRAKGHYATRFTGIPQAKITGKAYNILVQRLHNGEKPYALAKDFNVHGSTTSRIAKQLFSKTTTK